MKSNIRAIFTKRHPNTSNNICYFVAIFQF